LLAERSRVSIPFNVGIQEKGQNYYIKLPSPHRSTAESAGDSDLPENHDPHSGITKDRRREILPTAVLSLSQVIDT